MPKLKIDLQRSDQAHGAARSVTLGRLVHERPDFARLALVQLHDRGPDHWGVAVVVDEGYDRASAEAQLRWLVELLCIRVQSAEPAGAGPDSGEVGQAESRDWSQPSRPLRDQTG